MIPVKRSAGREKTFSPRRVGFCFDFVGRGYPPFFVWMGAQSGHGSFFAGSGESLGAREDYLLAFSDSHVVSDKRG